MQELRASRSQVGQSDIVVTSFEGIGDVGPAKVSLHTGEKLANVNSKSLSRGGRSSIIFRVIGDDSFGWAEAAALWGGDVDVIVHRQLSNHQINEQFNLPCSVPVALAPVPPLANSRWNGILLITIRGENDAQDAGSLFERWQPLIAILALPSTLSRSKRNAYSSFNKGSFKQDGYDRRDIKISDASVGGVTES